MRTLVELENYAGGELQEIVAEYLWRPEDASGKRYDVEVKIKVYQRAGGRFMAIPSHGVETPSQATSYMSLEIKDSIEAALMDCIGGFKMFMKSADETTWPPNEYF